MKAEGDVCLLDWSSLPTVVMTSLWRFFGRRIRLDRLIDHVSVKLDDFCENLFPVKLSNDRKNNVRRTIITAVIGDQIIARQGTKAFWSSNPPTLHAVILKCD